MEYFSEHMLSLPIWTRRQKEKGRRSVSRILFPLLTWEGNGHSSRRAVTNTLKRSNPEGEWDDSCPLNGPLLFDLAPDGVYPASLISQGLGELLPHLFTLTSASDPVCHWRSLFCGTFPASRQAAVSSHPAPRSPDFPRSCLHRTATVQSPPLTLGLRDLF